MQKRMRGDVLISARQLYPRLEYLLRVIKQRQTTLIGELQAILPCIGGDEPLLTVRVHHRYEAFDPHQTLTWQREHLLRTPL